MTRLSSDAGLAEVSGDLRKGGSTMNWTWQDLAVEPPRGICEAATPEAREAKRVRERDEAFERGFNEGLSAGRRQAMKELSPNLQASVSVVAEMEEFQGALIDQMQDNMTALSLAVARQLMEREVRSDPEVVANLIRSALTHFPLDQKLQIRLNPIDLSSISLEKPGKATPVSAGREVRWIPDESITRGGCVVEGPERIVDGQVEAALERIYRTLSHG